MLKKPTMPFLLQITTLVPQLVPLSKSVIAVILPTNSRMSFTFTIFGCIKDALLAMKTVTPRSESWNI